MTPLQASNLRAWILDLETTTEPQTKRRLHRKESEGIAHIPLGFCCLGRACVVLNVPVDRVEGGDVFYQFESWADRTLVTEDWWKQAFGLPSLVLKECWEMNDIENKSFPQIAAYLRQFLPSQEPA